MKNLLQSQANEVYQHLVETQWNPADFEWSEVPNPQYLTSSKITAPKLAHKPSGYHFIFAQYEGNFFAYFSPGKETIAQKKDSGSWHYQIENFMEWLQYLAREVNAPDLWSDLPTDSKLIESAVDEEDNSKFTLKEKKIIVDGIEEIKQYLLTAHKLDPELIEGQLKYLVDSADRLGRKDWKNALVAVIFSIIIQGGIAGHSAQEIFQYVWTILSAVLIHKLYLP